MTDTLPADFLRRWRHATTVAVLTLAPTLGCDDASRTAYVAQPMALRPLSSVTVSTKSKSVVLPLTTASALGRVVATGEDGCTSEVTINSAASDGTCALTMRFKPRANGPGLGLVNASLVARNSVGVCAPLADRLPTGDAEVVYTLSDGAAWVPWVEPKTSAAAGDTIAVNKVLFDVRGEITLRADNGGDEVLVGDHSVRIGGDIALQIDDSAPCTPCTAQACQSPYPAFRLRDAQPKSTAYNLEYSLDRWLGHTLVVILTQGW